MSTLNVSIPSRWSRAGAMFNAAPADKSPDLCRLLIDSIGELRDNSRIFIMAATWLARYGSMVDIQRLAQLIREELAPDASATMGLLLESALELSEGNDFALAIAQCTPAAIAEPLFDVERNNPVLRKLVEEQATATSRKWKRLIRPFQPKFNAIRPESWIRANNPSYGHRIAVS